MKKLNLILKSRWYDITPAGGKNYEYREIKEYYQIRFCVNFHTFGCRFNDCSGCKNFNSRLFDCITLWKGYTKTHRNFWAGLDEFFEVSISKIDPGIWEKYETDFLKDGYEKEKYYFCIPLTEKYFNH